MGQIDHTWDYAWHRALNAFNQETHHAWMYRAKEAAHEIPRLTRLFEMERTETLPQIHQQCSHGEPVPVVNNHLTCCLAVVCKECPFLLALEASTLTPAQQDTAKAFTCVTHILGECGTGKVIDTSEGFILTVEDRMYWDRVYEHLAGDDPDAEEFGEEGDVGEAARLRAEGYPELPL